MALKLEVPLVVSSTLAAAVNLEVMLGNNIAVGQPVPSTMDLLCLWPKVLSSNRLEVYNILKTQKNFMNY